MTLLDLSLEPVVSSEEPCDEKNLQEFEPEERESFLKWSSLKPTQSLMKRK